MFDTIDGVIFDCDGVLFESRRANLAYYSAVLKQFDRPPVDERDRETVAVCHTAASPEVFAYLLGEDQVAAALDVASRLHYRQFIPWMDPEPDLAEVLATLAATRPLAVATNRGTSMAEILEYFELEQYFSAVVTSRDVARPKPHADMLLLAAKQLQIDCGRLLFVGDSLYDKLAADAAGMPFMAYKPQFKHTPALTGHAELLALLS